DRNVTGVQTCALPISARRSPCASAAGARRRDVLIASSSAAAAPAWTPSPWPTRVLAGPSPRRRAGGDSRRSGGTPIRPPGERKKDRKSVREGQGGGQG